MKLRMHLKNNIRSRKQN